MTNFPQLTTTRPKPTPKAFHRAIDTRRGLVSIGPNRILGPESAVMDRNEPPD